MERFKNLRKFKIDSEDYRYYVIALFDNKPFFLDTTLGFSYDRSFIIWFKDIPSEEEIKEKALIYMNRQRNKYKIGCLFVFDRKEYKIVKHFKIVNDKV